MSSLISNPSVYGVSSSTSRRSTESYRRNSMIRQIAWNAYYRIIISCHDSMPFNGNRIEKESAKSVCIYILWGALKLTTVEKHSFARSVSGPELDGQIFSMQFSLEGIEDVPLSWMWAWAGSDVVRWAHSWSGGRGLHAVAHKEKHDSIILG